ncbi:hypothetical protein Syun_027674 [Stephania yunnanensis]|uniref:Uncharacterized protein n=1 Tax=Stephania yunnanensis TaxID=152371 RepID=A0AAP0ELI1_9MAGN
MLFLLFILFVISVGVFSTIICNVFGLSAKYFFNLFCCSIAIAFQIWEEISLQYY